MTELLTLLEYTRYASERTLQAVSVLTPEAYTKDLGSSFPSIRDTLVHIYAADRAWLGRIQDRTPERPNPIDYPDVIALHEVWLEVLSSWPNVVQNLGDVEQVIAYKALMAQRTRVNSVTLFAM
jgi:uncharacterized damage-inducible protein DinB